MKKNVASKILAGALASAMVLSMAACGEGETQPSSSTPASSTPASGSSTPASTAATPEPTADPMASMSISIRLPSDNTHSEANEWHDKLVDEINAYTNMDITWEWLPMADYFSVVGNDIIANNLADVMVVPKDATFLGAAEDGYFWDLTDYLADYDNFAVIPDAVLANCAHNGRVYALPRTRNLGRNGWGYRIDWLNNLGLEEPTTLEAFEEMLRAFTYDDPDGNGENDTVGLFVDQWAGVWDIIMAWFGVPSEWGIDENGDLIHKSQTPEYKTALAKIRDWYAQGYINNGSNGIPDFLEISPGKARDQGLRTQLGGVGVQVLDDMRKVQTYFQDQGITTEDEIIFTLMGATDFVGDGELRTLPTTGLNHMIAISKKTVQTEEQLRRVLQCLNDLQDGECMNLMEYGWEGYTYDLDENGYVALYNADQLAASGVGSGTYNYGFNQIFTYITAEENARPVTRPPSTAPINKLEDQLKLDNEKYCVPNYGASYTSQFQVDNAGALGEILSTAQQAYIRGEIDEAALDEAIKRWWTAGGRIVTQEMNDAYQANK